MEEHQQQEKGWKMEVHKGDESALLTAAYNSRDSKRKKIMNEGIKLPEAGCRGWRWCSGVGGNLQKAAALHKRH